MHPARFLILTLAFIALDFRPARAETVAKSVTVAQFDTEDSYDPFADYSEFDEAAAEEEDINFFRNGRFVTIQLIGGYRGFTGTLASIENAGLDYGLALTYFFDLRFALQFSFLTGDHPISFNTPIGGFSGDVNFQDIGFDLKYYVNTQNVTKGLGKFNPYILVGMSEIFRTIQLANTSAFGKDNSTALDLGGGIEIPFFRNQMFYGAQAMFQVVTFPGSTTPIVIENNQYNTGITPNGYTYTLLGILGVNF